MSATIREARAKRKKRIRGRLDAAPPSGRASRCSAPTRRSTPSSSTTPARGTLVAARSVEVDGAGLKKSDVAKKVGELLAQRAKDKGIERVVFDRSGYLYHGRVKALAEGAREGGLVF